MKYFFVIYQLIDNELFVFKSILFFFFVAPYFKKNLFS